MNKHIEIIALRFIEVAVEDELEISKNLDTLGFLKRSEFNSSLSLYQQNKTNVLVNSNKQDYSYEFFRKHGPSIPSIGIVVDSVNNAIALAKQKGYLLVNEEHNHFSYPAIQWLGGIRIYLIEETKKNAFEEQNTTHNFQDNNILEETDHIAINVYPNQSQLWINAFQDLFGMTPLKKFNIVGKHTSFNSQAMINHNNKFRIVINESSDENSQISEYLERYHGEGIQHIAFSSKNIYSSVEKLKKKGLNFMPVPDSYYEKINRRLPHHQEDLNQLRKSKVLIDGDIYNNDILLQTFTDTLIGPIFFEIIQRKGNQGFGGGNIKALFESVEQEQINRGVLKVKTA